METEAIRVIEWIEDNHGHCPGTAEYLAVSVAKWNKFVESLYKKGSMERPDWHEYFINISREVSHRATCPRASVGAVIVKDHRVISTGYNGAPASEPHCYDEGCLIENNHCYRAVHAEVNAVCQAAKFGLSVDGAILYYFDSLSRSESCHNCIQVMKAAGLVGVMDRNQRYMSLRNKEYHQTRPNLYDQGGFNLQVSK